MKLLYILCTLSVIRSSEQKSTPEDDHYVAAVVEYQVRSDTQYNLNSYVSLIGQAAAQNADIVVFPATTLTSDHSVPVPIHGLLQQYPVPALNPEHYDEVLVTLSNAARVNQIYMVVNIEELMDCTVALEGENCPNSTRYLFNTNVVFDRNGAVINRYRKINLSSEFPRTAALTPDLGYFETDFGVRFGHFICFDLMFQVPAIQTVHRLNVTDVIITSTWSSEMPYLSAVQIQEAYAYAENVNFLAASANNIRFGGAGSGIYSGRLGALASMMPSTDTTKLLVERIPKIPGRVNWTFSGPQYNQPLIQDNLRLKRDPSVSAHVTRILKPGYQEFVLSHNEVTCSFRIRMASRGGAQDYQYRAAAFDGVRTFDGLASAGVRTCAIYACVDDNIENCAVRFDTYIQDNAQRFEELFISAKVPSPSFDPALQSIDTAYFPVSLDVAIMPLKVDDYEVDFPTMPASAGEYNMRLLNSDTHLLSFGIWGRTFQKDGLEPTAPGSGVVVKSTYAIVVLLTILNWLY